jgi:[ribosomal protein S5]-alanine N-acetyltransferase
MSLVKFICNERIYLREVRKSDVNERYYNWLNDPVINQYLETRFLPRSIDNILSYVNEMDAKADEPFFAICLKDNDEHIGNIKLGPINWFHRRAAISLLIGEKKYWGKGYATDAISLVTKFGFETLNLNKLSAGCYSNNIGSARAFEKCGYVREGVIRSYAIVNNKELDCFLYGLRAEEFFAVEKD